MRMGNRLVRRYVPEFSRRLSSIVRLSSLPPSETLELAFPRLRDQFKDASNDEGVFPLLSEKEELSLKRNQSLLDKEVDRQAAVLMLVCSLDEKPSIVFTRRSRSLSTHASEMAFPGGHVEAIDGGSLVSTALREAKEELGQLDGVKVIGSTSSLPSLHGTQVTPVLGVLPYELPSDVESVFPGNEEVDQTIAIPLAKLLSTETTQSIPKRRLSHAPVYPMEGGGTIWGLTAYILRPILHRLYKPAFRLVAE